MKTILSAITATLLLALPGHAGERPVVVELFTSQGCSSCPPADAFLHKLAEREDVIPLALHVDYWDYIGWKDSFANPEHTKRQRAYAKAQGQRMVYTPQMVIDGADHVVGNRPKDVLDVIDARKARPDTIKLTLAREGDAVAVNAERLDSAETPLEVTLLRISPRNQVRIKAGENKGRTLNYANVVTEMRVVDTWQGKQPLDLTVPIDGDAPVVILLQRDSGSGPIEAAMMLP